MKREQSPSLLAMCASIYELESRWKTREIEGMLSGKFRASKIASGAF